MIGFGERYVVDTNALTQLKRQRRATSFFRLNAVIPSAVLNEARGFPDVKELRENEQQVSARTLSWLVRVMETVPVDDLKLIDLYANKGGADPLVVACALEGRELDSQYIDAPEWVIVTGDGAVRLKAEAFGLRVISSSDFADIIDGVGGEHDSARIR